MASDLETVVDLLYLLVYLIQAVDNTVPSRPKPTKVTPLGLCFNSAPLIETAEFVGRNTEIENIHAVLRPDEARKEQKRVVLGGIGGIGKTQLAIAYARQYQQSYTSVLWLNAASESTLYASLLPVAQAISAEQTDLSTNEQVLAGVLKWLNRPDNARWLLVFDNYDEPDLFAINDFCPSVGHGSIIVTTRLPDLAKGKIVRVQPLQSIEDSLSILEIRSGRSGIQEDSSAKRLARRLSGFPLALVTAGAFLRKSTMTFEQYLDVYERKWNINPRRPLRLQDYQDRTLYTTWNLSYNRLRNEDPDAAQMLRLMAYFDNQNVWYDLLTAGLMDDLPEWLQTTLEDKTDFEGAMAVLVDYCLLEVQHTSQSYSMHSCVHDWTLSELNTTMSPELYWYAFNCVAKIIKNVDRDLFGYVKYNYVSRHARRLTHPRFETCDELEAGIVGREDKAMDIAQMLKEQVQLSAAEQMYIRALIGRETALGLDHTSTLTVVYNLGSLYRNQGKVAELARLVATWATRTLTLFGVLGRALLQVHDDHNARTSFEYQIKSEEGILLFAGAQCDACGGSLVCAKGRYVCRQCADIDLCGGCWTDRQGSIRLLPVCEQHSFLEVLPDMHMYEDSGLSAGEEERALWCSHLGDKYS